MFDYVIVGAGSAGCVLAGRLSEDPAVRVLVLEAGPPDEAPEIRMPAATPLLWQGPYAWDDTTTPQAHAGDRSLFWPRGRTLGGSSTINGMVYIRGNRADYDAWRDEHGCAGWGYDDLLPYFVRAEDQQRGAGPYHGVGGPLRVEDGPYRQPVSEAWVAAVSRGSGRRARLMQVLAHIEANLADPGLTPAALAGAHHMSLRSLHTLFEQHEATVAGWIRHRRLERSRRDLLDPMLSELPVSAVAARSGLVDPAQFSRSFRAAYGSTPVEYRRAAREAPGSTDGPGRRTAHRR